MAQVSATEKRSEFIDAVDDDALAEACATGEIDESSAALRSAEQAHVLAWRRHTGRGADEPSVGLALSGGGIRSATFGLGVLQALAKADHLKDVDYLSTVSGGGYIGSALSWLVGRQPNRNFGVGPKDFPYGTDDPTGRAGHTASKDQDSLLKYLRQHGNYLTPGKGITLTSLIAVVLRGMLANLIVWLPIFMAGMLALLFASGLVPGQDDPRQVTPVLFVWSLLLSLGLVGMFLAASVVYSLATWAARGQKAARYLLRRWFENVSRWVLWGAVFFVVLGSLPAVEGLASDKIEQAGGLGLLLSGAASGVWAYVKTGKAGPGRVPIGLVATLGAGLFIYGVFLSSYLWAVDIFNANLPAIWAATGVLLAVALAAGWFVNLNYISVHRFYRDRLMETFLPDLKTALAGGTGPAREADAARLHPGPDVPRGPYHIVNGNVVLVDSAVRKLRIRGGDSFVLSPRYCGSNATGWIPTDRFMANGMTLATAMAISGAAANPHTGVGGTGLTRNRLVSLLMALLNLRLGYWASHPDPEKRGWGRPNHFDSARYEILPDGYRETSGFIQLSDGGHFENLGLYELIRRRLKLIVVSDAGADPDFSFSDLQITVRRVRDDFGALIDFDDDNHPKLLIPQDDLIAGYPRRVKLAKRGHILGKITYADQSEGTLIYMKTTMIQGLSLELLGYKSAHPDFPDETTADQFFDEEQFEAYRELGYKITSEMVEMTELGEPVGAGKPRARKAPSKQAA
jgi:hypothetical protein